MDEVRAREAARENPYPRPCPPCSLYTLFHSILTAVLQGSYHVAFVQMGKLRPRELEGLAKPFSRAGIRICVSCARKARLNHWTTLPGASRILLGSKPACLSACLSEENTRSRYWLQSWTRRVSLAPLLVLGLSPEAFVLRSPSGTEPPSHPVSVLFSRQGGGILSPGEARGEGRSPLLPAWHLPALEEPGELSVCPPQPHSSLSSPRLVGEVRRERFHSLSAEA